ncbi:MAG TPA: DUF2062 domain-containing protein [Tepidisphaeraceae bacterium]|jgi:uncharacterized protein (DUF2062 family)|nr:DUF2062 domain-containing protein [Tepidisphaeraceae bacterium]
MNAPADTHPFDPAIIVPLRDAAGELPALIERLASIDLPLIVIADGPADGISQALEGCRTFVGAGLPLTPSSGTPGEGRGGGSPPDTAKEPHDPPAIRSRANGPSALVIHSNNRHRGRGHALRAGFAAAIKAGHTHAVTLRATANDTVEAIQTLISAAREHRHSLIVSSAEEFHSRGPTSVLLTLESGVHVRDPRRGLRVYPLSFIALAPCRANGSAYEIEILARAGWSRCPIIEVPIDAVRVTHHAPDDGPLVPSPGTPPECRRRGQAPPKGTSTPIEPAGQVSLHSRPSPDTLREIAMHVRLLARRLGGWSHPKYRAGNGKAPPPFWRGLGQWLNPLRAWRELRRGEFGRTELASGIAVGVFIANLPVFGVQTLLALYVARRLHLHPLAVVAGSKVSTPPVGPLLIAAAIWLGHLLLHGSRLTWKGLIRPMDGHVFQAMLPLLLDWIVGATLIGTGLAVLTFAAVSLLFRSVPARPDKVAAP